MPLLTCPECSHAKVSSFAEACPNCHCPIEVVLAASGGQTMKRTMTPPRIQKSGVNISASTSEKMPPLQLSSANPISKVELQHDSSSHTKPSKAQLRSDAEAWVNGYTATAVGMVAATAIVPGAATGILCTLEASMCLHIGKMYKGNFSMAEATAAAGTIGLAAVAGKIAAMEAAILTGPFAFAIKPAIAGAIVKILGQAVINYFEERA